MGLREGAPDCVLIDVNLGGWSSFDLARILHQRCIPFLFFTDHDANALPPELARVKWVEKPMDAPRPVQTAENCCVPPPDAVWTRTLETGSSARRISESGRIFHVVGAWETIQDRGPAQDPVMLQPNMLKSMGDQPQARLLDLSVLAAPAQQENGQRVHEHLRRHWAASLPSGVSLTSRERQCLLLVADGCSDAAIAAALGLSRLTVVAHVRNARTKLNARTRAQAVARFLLLPMS